jgi:replicative DNA helicase
MITDAILDFADRTHPDAPAPLVTERAERVLLAGLLRAPQLVTEACLRHGVKEKHLYHHAHRLVWDAVWSLVKSGAVPDLVGVWQTLRCRKQTRELGVAPAAWLADVYDADPTGAWADTACKLVVAHARRRERVHAAREVLRTAGMGR